VGLVRWWAPAIEEGGQLDVELVVSYIGGAMLMGASLVWAMLRVADLRPSKLICGGVILVGLAARLILIGSVPVLEDDWYRYLWDGAVVATGTDPYAWAPAEAVGEGGGRDDKSAKETSELSCLREIAQEYTPYPQRINYPLVKTIDPPVAQVGFGLAASLKPFSLDAWRLILLG